MPAQRGLTRDSLWLQNVGITGQWPNRSVAQFYTIVNSEDPFISLRTGGMGKDGGFSERFAQEALGHNSVAVHRAYAKRAKVKMPSLEEYKRKIAALPLEP